MPRRTDTYRRRQRTRKLRAIALAKERREVKRRGNERRSVEA